MFIKMWVTTLIKNLFRPNSLVIYLKNYNKEVVSRHRLISKGKSKATRKDYQALKSGYDSFSKIRLPELVSACDPNVVNEIKLHPKINEDRSLFAVALRWHLRGLPLEMAIEKALVDKDTSSIVSEKRKRATKF
jgi:hypothetical protein